MLKFRAFTLVELLLGLSLLGILLFFTLPFESSLHQKNQVQVIQDDIIAAVRYAKTNALTRGKNVILTPLVNSHDWSDGMMLFIDNATHRYTPDDKLLHEWHWPSTEIHVSWKGFQSSHYLLFSADATQNSVNGSFLINGNSKHAVKIVINKLGRIKKSTSQPIFVD